MPRLKLPLRADLDESSVRSELERRVGDRLRVEDAEIFPKRATSGFVVTRSEWEGAAVRVRQKADSTFVTVNGIVPSLSRRLLVVASLLLFLLPGALAILYFFYLRPRELVKEVVAEIERLFAEAGDDGASPPS
jgi:hypothetical protein